MPKGWRSPLGEEVRIPATASFAPPESTVGLRVGDVYSYTARLPNSPSKWPGPFRPVNLRVLRCW